MENIPKLMSGCAAFRKRLYFSEPQLQPRERICTLDCLKVEMLSKAWCEWPLAVKVESQLVMDTVSLSRRGHRKVPRPLMYCGSFTHELSTGVINSLISLDPPGFYTRSIIFQGSLVPHTVVRFTVPTLLQNSKRCWAGSHTLLKCYLSGGHTEWP